MLILDVSLLTMQGVLGFVIAMANRAAHEGSSPKEGAPGKKWVLKNSWLALLCSVASMLVVIVMLITSFLWPGLVHLTISAVSLLIAAFSAAQTKKYSNS
ncbi:MAG TPA: hypothetical protein VM581_02615 [Magnetospirillaceae bacterium]|nr:hypothetical protein [Magnetospirillaceae bacterium]